MMPAQTEKPKSLREPFRPAQGQSLHLEPGSATPLRLRTRSRRASQGPSACLFYTRRFKSQAWDAAGLRSPDARQRPKIVRTPAPRLSCTGQARPGVARERRLSPSAPAQDLPIGPLTTPAGAGAPADLRDPNPRQHRMIVLTSARRPPCTRGTRPGVARERLLSPCPQDMPIGPLTTPAGAGRGKPTGLACLPRVGSGRGRRSGD
jgi:hypothetical protein